MNPFLVVLIILAILGILLFVGLWIIYYKVFYNSKKSKNKIIIDLVKPEYDTFREQIKENIEKVKNIPYEVIKIPSKDDKTLVAKYYHVDDKAPVDILCHGYKGSGLRDFCGGLQISLEMGHNVILIDHRAHGESDGHTISFGIKERQDVLDWIYYCRIRFGNDVKIFLIGISMGASTVLMTQNLKLPKNVVGIIADSPYTSPKDIILKVVNDMKLPAKLLSPFIKLSALIFGHFKLDECNAIDAIKKCKLPILLIHGKADSFVPYEMSEQIKSDYDNVQLELFEDASHGMSYLVDEKRYKAIVSEFINKVLNPKK